MQRLKNHWASRHIEFNDGVPQDYLAAFEDQFRVVLPPDMRDFYLTMNGMSADTTDEDLIRFWTLQEVKPISSEAPSLATPDYIDNAESLFVFADYSLWAHAYAIRLDSRQLDRNEIFIIGGDNPVLLFRAFSELVDSYLADKSLMFA